MQSINKRVTYVVIIIVAYQRLFSVNLFEVIAYKSVASSPGSSLVRREKGLETRLTYHWLLYSVGKHKLNTTIIYCLSPALPFNSSMEELFKKNKECRRHLLGHRSKSRQGLLLQWILKWLLAQQGQNQDNVQPSYKQFVSTVECLLCQMWKLNDSARESQILGRPTSACFHWPHLSNTPTSAMCY